MDGFSNTLSPARIGRKDGLDSVPFVPDGEVDNLLMEPLACPELVPSPPILNPSYFMADAQLCSGSHQSNQLSSSQAHAHNLVSTTPYTGSHGMNVPRFRAQRGKATDPHSIAERHRRERISDWMKNLHNLIPNSNKTDKASMLDEIIDYIKFLQLEMKKPRGRLASAPAGSSGSDASQEDDDGTTGVESGNKELSLMPIELASAISTEKGTHTAVIPTEMQIMDSAISGAPFLGIPF